MIESYTELSDAVDAMFYLLESNKDRDYLKGEIVQLDNGRWRVGLVYGGQMEFDFGEDD